MVKNKYRQKKAPAEPTASGPKKTPIVSPHEFDGLIGFEEVQDYTLIKGRFGKSTRQIFKNGKLMPKPKRKRNRKPKRPREEQSENNTDDVGKTAIESNKENKDNTDEVTKTSLDNSKENENNESKKDVSAKEVVTESNKESNKVNKKNKSKKNVSAKEINLDNSTENENNESKKDVSAKEVVTESNKVNKNNKSKKNVSAKEINSENLKNSKNDTVKTKEKKKKKSKKDITAKKNVSSNLENSKKDKVNSKEKKKKKRKNRNNNKRNQDESSVDSAKVEEIITDESGIEVESKIEDKSPSQKRKSDDEPSTVDTALSSKKARYNTSVYKGTSDGTKVDVSAWKDIFTPDIVMEALADLGFSQPTEIQRLTLPAAIKGRKDIVGAAETGSGKTLAFGIPIIHGILHDRESPSDDEDDDSDSGWEEEVIHDGSQAIEPDNELTGSEEENEDVDMKKDEGDLLEETVEEMFDENEDDDSDDEIDDDMEILGAEGELEEVDPDELAREIDGDSENENDDIDIDEDELGEEEEELGEEVLEPLDESGLGCVKVINNVSFDFLDAESGKFKNDAPLGKLRALIVTPTRELAMQVKSHLDGVLVHSDIKTAVVVGGMSQQKQERLLRRCPEIVVGTPGRLWEMVQQGNRHLLQLPRIRYLAIDETDRMLERGHFQELHDLLELINSEEKSVEKRQTFVFSATLSTVHTNPKRFNMKKKAVQLTSKMKIENLMNVIGVKPKPKIVDVTRQFGTAEALTEARINCTKDEKDYYLYYFLRQYPGRTLVFCNSIDCVRRLQNLFTILNCNPHSLHASMHQKQRLKSLERFTSDPRCLLLATDVAARGLDIPLIQHVIHYQVPRTAETYVHRSGRTARATQEGLSILMVDSSEMTKYRQICTTLNRVTDLPPFPNDLSIMNQVKKRVNLGREVEKMEHTNRKSNAEDNWFRRAAAAAELHFEEEELDEFEDRDKTSQAKRNKQELKVKRAMLNQLLAHPLISANFSGKYPTKTGGLLNPLTDDLEVNTSEGSKAINVMKKEKVVIQSLLKKVKDKAPVKKVNKKKNKGFEKRRLKKEKEQKEQLKAMEQGKAMDSGSGRRRGKKDSGMETFSC